LGIVSLSLDWGTAQTVRVPLGQELRARYLEVRELETDAVITVIEAQEFLTLPVIARCHSIEVV
jgi:hypothetical protein